jgi:hypothetical protein
MILEMMETYNTAENKQSGDYLGYLRNAQGKHPGRISDFQLFGYLVTNL